jgi:hypothetical protein
MKMLPQGRFFIKLKRPQVTTTNQFAGGTGRYEIIYIHKRECSRSFDMHLVQRTCG